MNLNISFISSDLLASWGIRDLQIITLGCQFTCFTCTGPSENECSKCAQGYYLQGTFCLTDCPSGTYGDDDSGMCLDCDESCSECLGPDYDQCTICIDSLFLLDFNCLDVCPSGYYSDNSATNTSSICSLCDDSCLECNGPSNANCTLCNDSIAVYLSNNQCLSCDPRCDSCKGPSASDCLDCSANYFNYKNSCTNIVPMGYFLDQIAGQSFLLACDSSCKTCSNTTKYDCLSCASNLLLSITGECMTGCSSGTFYNLTTKVCTVCDPSCKECNGTLVTNCTGFFSFNIF